ncbi:DUF2213 domain-containing protein [Lacrimispora sp.]|uniref:DUF2213 domain-containing protein n=1 Tax=Lacrimispora sp. TaxID=2719234 RepID=UPI0028AD7411|nr:DUF2213 domain-containing protein [Lacrimispora sp.]
MLAYYGYTISPNQIETGEGFLICRNVPIARTGSMDYLESELNPTGSSSKMVKVLRSPEEVFSPAALSSFEGKPVTNEHPPELLTAETCSFYAKGHAQNVRKGEGEWNDCVMADLHVQDENLIREVQEGKREISCGYECTWLENGDGTYSQHNIRGNHIAVVSRGRAGKNVAILDSEKRIEATWPERKDIMKKSSLFKLFVRAAKDASPEELESMAADAAEALGGETKAEPVMPPAKEEVKDFSSLDAKLDKLMDLLSAKKEPEVDQDPLEGLIEALTGGEGDPASGAEAKVIPAEELDKATGTADKAVMAEVIKKLRPVIAGIKDSADKKAVTDSLIAYLTDKDSVSEIAKIAAATQKNASRLTDKQPGIDLDACQSAYDAMNPHKNGGKK